MGTAPGDFARSFAPLFVIERGGEPDVVSFGALAVAEPGGRVVARLGSPDLVAYLRSSAKPFQAIAFLRRGLHSWLRLGAEEIACACASHSGEREHVEAARRILDAAAITEGSLLCGTHPPFSDRGSRPPGPPQPIHNNCSGKHAAMLSVCRHEGWDVTTYPEADHPLQLENLATLATFAGVETGEILVARDNCTVPTFGLSLKAAARAFARLFEPGDLDAGLATAGSIAVNAMTTQPAYVGGSGRLDTAIMQVTRGRLVVKTGANGYYAGAQRASEAGPALGFALKLSAAEGEAAKAPIVLEVLRAADLLSATEHDDLAPRFAPRLVSSRGHVVGTSRFIGVIQAM